MTLRYKKNDEIFTDLKVVHYLLDEVNFMVDNDLSHIRLLEPSAGKGIFALEIITRLHLSSKRFGFNFLDALNENIKFVELKEDNFKSLKQSVLMLIVDFGYSSNLVQNKIFINDNYLKLNFSNKFDCIVGNPPYIRHEIIDKTLKDYYKIKFFTFKYRADLYILFYEHSLNLLCKHGKLSFICSNRWLYNQYGHALREKISTEYHLNKLVNIENSTSFNESVIAYPAITTIENNRANTTFYYETDSKKIYFNEIIFNVKKTPKNAQWQNLFLDYDIENTSLKSIEAQGFHIGIGIATGADNIFIINQSENIKIEKSRLLPLLKSNALKGDKIEWDGSFLINPFENEKLCDLNKFPYMKKYFLTHKTKLFQRYIAKKQPKNWYKTIDKIKSDLLDKSKLILPDLANSQFLFIDKGEYYPHHNLYYIIHENNDKLKILASILMSNFIKKQLSQIGIRMNGGLPRFQAQTLKKLRIPNIENFSKSNQNRLIIAYDTKDFNTINHIIEEKGKS